MQVSIEVPDSLADISVGQYQEWKSTIEMQEWSEIRQKIITVSIFCKADIDTIESISIKNLNKINGMILRLLEGAFKNDLQKVIELDGVKYGFHPDLNEMTTGEWADLEEELREKEDLWKAMPNILAILYRPLKGRKWWKFWDKSYQIENYEPKHMENADRMKEVNMETASGMAVFFWNLGIEYTKSFIQSIKQQQKQTAQA